MGKIAKIAKGYVVVTEQRAIWLSYARIRLGLSCQGIVDKAFPRGKKLISDNTLGNIETGVQSSIKEAAWKGLKTFFEKQGIPSSDIPVSERFEFTDEEVLEAVEEVMGKSTLSLTSIASESNVNLSSLLAARAGRSGLHPNSRYKIMRVLQTKFGYVLSGTKAETKKEVVEKPKVEVRQKVLEPISIPSEEELLNAQLRVINRLLELRQVHATLRPTKNGHAHA